MVDNYVTIPYSHVTLKKARRTPILWKIQTN